MEILSNRLSVVRTDAGLSIVISSNADRSKSRTVAILLALWIVGGIIMIWSLPSINDGKSKIAMFIWLAFWVYFLYVMFRLWQWKKNGHEVIKIANGVMKYKKDVRGRGWVHDFALAKIQKLRISETQNPTWLKNIGGDFWNTDCDSLRFNYEDREMSIGYQLEMSERQKLLNVLGEYVNTEEQQSKRSQKESNWKGKPESE
jgi:hypothetical protein